MSRSKGAASGPVKLCLTEPVPSAMSLLRQAWLVLGLRDHYLCGMKDSRPFLIWSHALRVMLVLALLAIAPLYETAHALQPMAEMSVTMPDMTAQSEGTEHMADGRKASHLAHDAACRILCFGWVVGLVPVRPEGLTTKLALVLTPTVIALLGSISPAPSDHPPKLARFI